MLEECFKKGRFLLAYILYISFVIAWFYSPSINSLKNVLLGENATNLGISLELLTLLGLFVSNSIIYVIILFSTHERNFSDNIKAAILGIMFFPLTFFLIIDITYLEWFTLLQHLIIIIAALSIITFIDLIPVIAGFFSKWKEKIHDKIPINKKTTLYGADLPLLAGLFLVLIISVKIEDIQTLETFIGGVLVFKIGYYYASFAFINTVFLNEKD